MENTEKFEKYNVVKLGKPPVFYDIHGTPHRLREEYPDGRHEQISGMNPSTVTKLKLGVPELNLDAFSLWFKYCEEKHLEVGELHVTDRIKDTNELWLPTLAVCLEAGEARLWWGENKGVTPVFGEMLKSTPHKEWESMEWQDRLCLIRKAQRVGYDRKRQHERKNAARQLDIQYEKPFTSTTGLQPLVEGTQN